MKEFEYKLFLSRDDYQSLTNYLVQKYKYCNKNQINYYYDTKDNLFHKNDITIRMRQIEDKLNLEVKVSIKRDKNLSEKHEINRIVSNLKEVNDKIRELDLLNNTYSNTDIKMFGTLITDRINFIVNDYISIDLDKSYYLGKVDYELELEFKPEYQEYAESLFNHLSLKVTKCLRSPGGKRERFFSDFHKMLSI